MCAMLMHTRRRKRKEFISVLQIMMTMMLAVLLTSLVGSSLGSKIRMDSDGGYTGIVIKIKDDGSVPEDECPKILANLQVWCSIAFVWINSLQTHGFAGRVLIGIFPMGLQEGFLIGTLPKKITQPLFQVFLSMTLFNKRFFPVNFLDLYFHKRYSRVKY